MMAKNPMVDEKVRNELLKLYPLNDVKLLSRKISEWTSISFGVDVLGNGGSLSVDREVSKIQMSWIEKVNVLEDVILKYSGCSKYYVVFDELDEDYREISEQENLTQYKNLLTSLFKAVQDVKATFVNTDLQIMPIVFLRDDIYALLNDSDKNKWSDFKITLEWDVEKLKKLIAYRISKDAGVTDGTLSFEDAWYAIFNKNKITFGDHQCKQTDSFDFISRSTQLRPRDFIKYIQACCEQANAKEEKYISNETIKRVDREFSNYLKDEITDEIYPILPEISTIFQIFSNIRKQLLPSDEFINQFNEYVVQGTISQQTNVNFVLDVLFRFSVIGNENRFRKGYNHFKYIQSNMTYNKAEKIVIHRGLFKALQIY